MTWGRWQRLCGWAALGCAVAWGTKFVIIAATSARPGAAEVLTGFVLPSLGSLLGLIAALGIAAPLVAGRGRIVRIGLSVAVGFAAVLAVSALSDALYGWSVIANSANEAVRTDAPVLASTAIFLAVGWWLLRGGSVWRELGTSA